MKLGADGREDEGSRGRRSETGILAGWLDDEKQLDAMADGTPQGVIAEPEDLAPLVGWLLPDATAFMTVSVVTADGGYATM